MSEIITDISFDLTRTKEYILSIQVSQDGFYFSVIHNNQLLALEKFPVKISADKFLGRRFSEWLSDRDFFEKPFAETRIVYFTGKMTVVPGDFYDYDKQDDIINLIFGKQNGYTSHDNYWTENRCNLVFSVPEQFLKEAGQKFSEFQLIHPATVLNQKIQPYLEDNNVIMALYFDNNSFCHILYSNRELKSVNCYNFTNADDVTFYVLSLLNINNISYKDTEIILAGEIEAYDEIYNKLNRHAGKVSIIKPQVTFDPEIFINPMHRFNTIV